MDYKYYECIILIYWIYWHFYYYRSLSNIEIDFDLERYDNILDVVIFSYYIEEDIQ